MQYITLLKHLKRVYNTKFGSETVQAEINLIKTYLITK